MIEPDKCSRNHSAFATCPHCGKNTAGRRISINRCELQPLSSGDRFVLHVGNNKQYFNRSELVEIRRSINFWIGHE